MNRIPRWRVIAAATALLTVVGLAGCAAGPSAATTIRLGWAGEVPPLDPAASDSVGSFALLSQLYPSLLAVDPEDQEPTLEIAATAEWTADGVYTVTLKSGLAFANGDQLTSSDVKFSIERQLALQSDDGAWRQLESIDSVEIVDDTTVAFHVPIAIDTSLPYVLAGPAGLVLDEESFYADELTPDQDIIDAEAFAGAYALTAKRGDVLVLTPYSGYGGARPAISTIELHPGTGADLASQLDGGTIDAITGRLDVDTLGSLADNDAITLSRAASGRVRMLAFDLDHMPFGVRAEGPDATKALAVRTAISEIIDREAIAGEIGGSFVRPLYGYLPDGIPGASDVFTDLHGDGEGGPDVDLATAALTAAAIETPVELSIHVDLDEVGVPGSDEVAQIASQLEASGLFTVTVLETDADGLEAARLAGKTQAVFTSVLPANSDPQDYLEPFRSGGILAQGYADANVDTLLSRQLGEVDPEVRAATVLETQTAIATLLPAIPITQGVRVVFARSSIEGVELDDALPLDLSKMRH
jgi:peptide/nickel transport system substrate-binding protein